MAFISGALLGWVLFFFIGPIFADKVHSALPMMLCTLGFALGAALVYQTFLHDYFAGERRGEFEYAYWENRALHKVRMTLAGVPQRPSAPNLLDADLLDFDSMAYNPWMEAKAGGESDPERKFLLYLTMGFQAIKGDAYQKAAEALGQAVRVKPTELVANFRLAEVLEYLGHGVEAIRHYEAALNDPGLTSSRLRAFVQSQIERVKIQGPRKGSKMQGLRWGIW